MNEADLGLEYTAGILAPDPSQIGLIALVDSTGRNLTYGRTARPQARDSNGVLMGQDDVDLVPRVVTRFETDDGSPVAIAGIQIPIGLVATIRFEVHARHSLTDAHYWKRYDFYNRATGDAVFQLGSTIDEKPSIDTIGGTSVFFGISGEFVTFFFQGPATVIHALAIIKVEAYHVEPPTGV